MYNTPFFDKNVCIVDRKNAAIAAQISSYLNEEGGFLSVLEFPSVSIQNPNYFDEDCMDENFMSVKNAQDLSIRIENAINKIGNVTTLFLAGLSNEQKSYLYFLENYEVVEIESIEDVDNYLDGFAIDKEGYIEVKNEEILGGLFIAGRNKLKIKIKNTADSLLSKISLYQNFGLIIVENNGTVSAVSAINYALSMNLDIQIIRPLAEGEIEEFKLLIEEWKGGNETKINDLGAKLYGSIEHINFEKYNFVTFFTEGAPYSLVLKNKIPISYVHLNQYPTLFIIDGIFSEQKPSIGSAVIFSPKEFGEDEEINLALNILSKNNFSTKFIIGSKATSHNLDIYVKEYPFEIFHICSHGGEVEGERIVLQFEDRDSVMHIVEYDCIFTFFRDTSNKIEMELYRQFHWRKFDNLPWKSQELRNKKYNKYVFLDMLNAAKKEKKPKKSSKILVPNSYGIKCYDYIFMGTFNMVASFKYSPIIFNNTCWSWGIISEIFLNAGIRGYIGTFWNVNNSAARRTAEMFYTNLFTTTILDSLHKAIKTLEHTKDKDVYMYWGLHFSTVKVAKSISESRINIAKDLFASYRIWRDKYKNEINSNLKKATWSLSQWNCNELRENFYTEIIRIIRNIGKKD